MTAEIQPADERLRVRVLILLALVATLGAAGLMGLDHYLAALRAAAAAAPLAAAAKALWVARAILTLLAAAGVLLSLYLASSSWGIIRSHRYPAPGARVISDTRILDGRPARRRGLAGLALAALTLLLTLAVVARAHRLFSRLLETTLEPTHLEFQTHPERPPL